MDKINKNANANGNENPNVNVNSNSNPNSNVNSNPNVNSNSNANEKLEVHNLIIIDESGSMSYLTEATKSGVNEVLNTIKSAQQEFADTQDHFVSVVTFDTGGGRDDVRFIVDDKPVGEVGEFTEYEPCGCTPLYDAMGMSMSRVLNNIKGKKLATGSVTVVTDGLENASHEWNAAKVKDLIEQLKAKGWSFSYMGSAHDVKDVTDILSISHYVEFSHDDLGTRNSYRREKSAKMSLFRKMGKSVKMCVSFPSEADIVESLKQNSSEYYGERVTPERITSLNENQIYVFGSNSLGRHSHGSAKYAASHFGAVNGQAEGLQGQSYAIVTTCSLEELRMGVNRFVEFARQNPDKQFLVTKIGCGAAGYSVPDIAPLFDACIELENVSLPLEFWSIYGLKM